MNAKITTLFGWWLADSKMLTSFLSFATLLAELLIPVVIIFYPSSHKFRQVVIFLMISLHIGIFLSLDLDAINLIAAAALIPFLNFESQFFGNYNRLSSTPISKLLITSVMFLAVLASSMLSQLSSSDSDFSELRGQFQKYFFIRQAWSFFSEVPRDRGWHYFEFQKSPLHFWMPGCDLSSFSSLDGVWVAPANDCYKNIRWYKYIINFQEKGDRKEIFYHGLEKYFCQMSNAESFNLWWIHSRITSREDFTPSQKTLIFHGACNNTH